jgi:hypothetical protein
VSLYADGVGVDGHEGPSMAAATRSVITQPPALPPRRIRITEPGGFVAQRSVGR